MKLWMLLIVVVLFSQPAMAFSEGDFSQSDETAQSQAVQEVPPTEAPSSEEGSSNNDTLDPGYPTHISLFAGVTAFSNSSYFNGLSNLYTIGAAIDRQISYPLFVEVEGSFGENSMQVSYYKHSSYQFSGGASLKVAPTFTIVRPYVSGGLVANYYYKLLRYSFDSQDKWNCAGKFTAGVDLDIWSGLAIGIRGAVILPITNRNTRYRFFMQNTSFSQPEQQVDGTSFQFLGTVTIGL